MSASAKSGRANAFLKVLGFTFHHWRRQPALAFGISALMLSSTLCEMLVPLFAGRLVDLVAAGAMPGAATTGALIVAGIIAVNLVGIALRHFSMLGIVRFTLRMMVDVAEGAFARVQRFSTDWHASNFAGSTVRKITRGMGSLDLMNDTLVINMMPSSFILIGITTLFAWRWPLLGVVVFVGAVIYLSVLVTMSLRVMSPAARLSNTWDTRLGGVIADSISCNTVVKGFGSEDREDDRLHWVLGKWRKRTRRTWTLGTWNGTLQLVLLTTLRATVLGLTVWLWSQGRASAGDVAFVLSSYALIDGYLRDTGTHVRNMQRSVNDMEELVDFHAEPIGVADRPGAGEMVVTRGSIRFDDVTFHYGAHPEPLYRNLGVDIAAGEKLALVGHSGSGKTTFVKLIQRLYDVTGGRIAIDGIDVRDVTQGSLRRQIAIVQQEPVLFHRSLMENIAYGRPGATLEEIMTAARRANAHGFIEKLPKGYATMVGERGVKLSGGERQRVAIARAFLADAPILILDEATSSLDAESEAAVQQAIERLMQGRTTIVIAHRLSTVRAMDRLLVFDDGQIVEQGSHADLMAHDHGVYRRLFERQMAAMADEMVA